jgi:hypothetical protein
MVVADDAKLLTWITHLLPVASDRQVLIGIDTSHKRSSLYEWHAPTSNLTVSCSVAMQVKWHVPSYYFACNMLERLPSWNCFPVLKLDGLRRKFGNMVERLPSWNCLPITLSMNIEHFDFLPFSIVDFFFFFFSSLLMLQTISVHFWRTRTDSKLLSGYLLGFFVHLSSFIACESIKFAGVLNPKWQGSSISTILKYRVIYDYLLDGMLFYVLYFVSWSYLLGFILTFLYKLNNLCRTLISSLLTQYNCYIHIAFICNRNIIL